MKQSFNLKKTFLITMSVALSISALIGIYIFLLGDFGETELKVLLTTFAVGGFSLTGLCCAMLYEKRKFPPLALFGMMISVIGFLFTVSVIWEAFQIESDDIWKALIILIILAVGTAHASVLLLLKSDKTLINSALSVTIITIAIVAIMLIVLTLNNFEDLGDAYSRLLGVFIILDALGTVVTPILNKVYGIQR